MEFSFSFVLPSAGTVQKSRSLCMWTQPGQFLIHLPTTAILAQTNMMQPGRTRISLSSPGHHAPTLPVTRPRCTEYCHDHSTPPVTPGPTQLAVCLLGLVSQPTPPHLVQPTTCNSSTRTTPLLLSPMVSLCPIGWFHFGQAGMDNLINSKLVVQESCSTATTLAFGRPPSPSSAALRWTSTSMQLQFGT